MGFGNSDAMARGLVWEDGLETSLANSLGLVHEHVVLVSLYHGRMSVRKVSCLSPVTCSREEFLAGGL